MLSSFEQSNLHGSSLAQQAISSRTINTLPAQRAELAMQVLVLAPHPDDESLGCGGTLRQLTDSGVIVDVAFMTRGELGGRRGVVMPPLDRLVLATQRGQEAVQACGILGVRNIHFLSGRDGDLCDQ